MKIIYLIISLCIFSNLYSQQDIVITDDDALILDSLVIVPDVFVPEDSLFWHYRFRGNGAWTVYNDTYLLLFDQFGDSLDVQFELYNTIGFDSLAWIRKWKYNNDEIRKENLKHFILGGMAGWIIYGIIR